jgi:hypothetical protein
VLTLVVHLLHLHYPAAAQMDVFEDYNDEFDGF